MKPLYVPRIGYTIVFTPHSRGSWRERIAHIQYKAILGQLDVVRERMKLGIVSGIELTHFGKVEAYLYCRRIFNYMRSREELEIISITPTNAFHSDGVSKVGHQHNETERVGKSDKIRVYCFCCRREPTEYQEYDDKFLCINHVVSCFHKE